jgi:hypothetical protein
MSEISEISELYENVQPNRILNYDFQQADSRDYKYKPSSLALARATSTPTFVLNQKNIKVLDQGNLGSCVSNAFAQYINIVTNNTLPISRLCHYYCGRAINGLSSMSDTGLNIRLAASIILKYGAAKEDVWPYVIPRFNELPPLNVFQNSKLFQKYSYVFMNQDLNTLKTFLINNKVPIIFGLTVYNSFVTQSVANTGTVPLPNTRKEKILGRHCALIIGYNDSNRTFICVNSWGKNWGSQGFFTLPYDFVTNSALARDFCSLSFIY